MEEHNMDGEKRLEEKCLERKVVYKGKSYEFFVDRVELPDGTEAVREMVKHPGGVAILAMDGENRVLMEEQYRYAICQTITEIPAGKMDKIPGETPQEAAVRELREETGRVADHWEYLGKIYPSPGIVSEVLYLYLATGLREEERELDSDEFINLKLMELGTVREKIAAGEITDCKTIAALAMAELRGMIE